jgi:DNA-binding transcriptional MerR regulator
MSALDEVKKMQQQGISEDQIVRALQDKGVPYKDISESLAQSKIRAAVEEPPSEPETTSQQPIRPQIAPIEQPNDRQSPEMIPGMQQSILQTTPEYDQTTQEYAPAPQPGANQPTEYGGYSDYGSYTDQDSGYQSYDYQSTGISSDTITEISEQIVAEKMMEMRKHIEKVTDFKTTIETKTEAIEERLKHIEKIIDTLQSSVLRKVGDYVTNVEDIKKELIATQKSFSKFVPEIKKRRAHTHKKTSKKKK